MFLSTLSCFILTISHKQYSQLHELAAEGGVRHSLASFVFSIDSAATDLCKYFVRRSFSIKLNRKLKLQFIIEKELLDNG